MIKTINLQKIFKTEEVETWALNNVSVEVKEGEFVAIMGPSGCGKSTLLNILGLLDNPTGGEYYLNGKEVSKYTESQRTNLRKGVIGFVFQSFNLIDELNVYENIELPLLYMGIPASERKQRVEKAMERMAITHRSKHFPQQLSGGQQQRVPVRFLYLCIQLLRRRRCLLQHPQKPLSIRAGFFTPFAVQPLPCFSEYSGKIQRNNNRTVNRHQQKSKQLMVHPINILIVKAVVVEL